MIGAPLVARLGPGRARCIHPYVMLIPVPAGRPCVDCHAFEFMQRALQDLRKTAYSLDARVSTQGQGGLAIVISIPRPSHSRDLGAELTWKRPHAQGTI